MRMSDTTSAQEKLKDKFSRKQGCVARNHEEVQGCELRGKGTVEWNTDLIETMKLEKVICKATQGVHSDEEQHESREADVHEDFTDRDEETQTMESLCQRRPSSRSVSIPRHT